MYGLKRLLEIEAERKKRKEEKAQLKKEKEKKKKEEKRLIRKKKLKSKQNKRAYKKRRDKILKEKEKIGDVYGYYMVYLTVNRVRFKKLGIARWKSKAYEIYNNEIERNKGIKFPVKTVNNNKKKSDVKYEIILTERAKDMHDFVKQFRNEQGMFVDNIVTDMIGYSIIAKNEWNIEETFHVYGYNPTRDRKDYDFILNEMILKDIDEFLDVKRIQVFQNKLLIMKSDDFDFVVCKTKDEAKRLYNTLEKDIELNHKKIKNIVFLGEITAKNSISDMLDKLENKTGWSRDMCKKSTTI